MKATISYLILLKCSYLTRETSVFLKMKGESRQKIKYESMQLQLFAKVNVFGGDMET